MTPTSPQPDDRALWSALTAGRSAAPRHDASQAAPPAADGAPATATALAISDLDWAAYLDGWADEATVERIEQVLANDPAQLATLVELRRLLEATAMMCPAAVGQRAKALVPQQAPLRRPAWSRWSLRLGYAACVALMIGLGFTTGMNMQPSPQVPQPMTVYNGDPLQPHVFYDLAGIHEEDLFESDAQVMEMVLRETGRARQGGGR